MIIGICGKSGCGKSTLSRDIMRVHDDAVHLEIDTIGHKVLEIKEVFDELVRAFGPSIVTDENIDRKKLGDLVFSSRDKMTTLSDITWKYMQIEIDKFINENKNKIIILDWILLPESKYFEMCDVKILLDIPYSVRKCRAMKRDSISSDSFDLRDNASIEFNREDFDYVLDKNDDENIKRLVKLL